MFIRFSSITCGLCTLVGQVPCENHRVPCWREILAQVRTATQQWQAIAAQEGVSEEQTHIIGNALIAIDKRLG